VDPFFIEKNKGRKTSNTVNEAKDMIVEMRKKYYSVEDIKVALDSKGMVLSERGVHEVLRREGFGRLPRRSSYLKSALEAPRIEAEKSQIEDFDTIQEFKSNAAGILCLLPLLKDYGIDELIGKSQYPETSVMGRLNSILSFVALKTCGVKRYSADDLWCMDRGLGAFSGLNVLPKAAWFSSYSHRVTQQMNFGFLKQMHGLWLEKGLLGDTANLDFTTIPYWGEDGHLENNWSGKRGKALSSMLAILAHDPDSGIINYGNTNVMHKNESDQVLEFLDFYRQGGGDNLNFLVFDSKFTTYQNLARLDDENIKFLTIRRRGKNMISKIEQQPFSQWKSIRVQAAGNKKRTLRILDQNVLLKGYDKNIRQITITGHGKTKPALIITNDFDLPAQLVVRRYSRRWLVEKAISEQIEFFHLNRLSSSIVIKVDFDLTMSILTHNLFRLLAQQTDRYQQLSNERLYQQFIQNSAVIKVKEDIIEVWLEKKRTLPIMLQLLAPYQGQKYSWLGNKKLRFSAASNS
jgi:hypothetical protein